MQEVQRPPLNCGLKIDEKIPAAADIEPGEGRIAQNILRRKDDHFPQLFLDAIGRFLLIEKKLEAFRRHFAFYPAREETRPGLVEGALGSIRGKNFYIEVLV